MELLTPRMVAELVGVTKRTIINWFNAGRFPNAFKVQRTIRIPMMDIENLKGN